MVKIEVTGKSNHVAAFINFLRQAQRDLEDFQVDEATGYAFRSKDGTITQEIEIQFDEEVLRKRKFRILLNSTLEDMGG